MLTRSNSLCTIAAAVALSFQLSTLADTTVIYVDAGAEGANDGSSWTSAFSDLQDALAHAADLAGDPDPPSDIHLWIAAGTYKPGTPDVGPGSTFNLVSGVALYGGFAGGEESLVERDWVENETVLSGLLSDTGSDVTRSHHVLTGSGLADGTRLDGLIVRDGQAWSDSPHDVGAGLLLANSAIHVENCTFTKHFAFDGGGGINAVASNVTVVNSRFVQNSAYGDGGAIRVVDGALHLHNCEFIANSVSEGAGAIRTTNSTLVALNTLFLSNTANLALGGPAAARVDGDSTFINCDFHQNAGYYRAHLRASGSLTVDGCSFTEGGDGPAISGSGTLNLSNSFISGNTGGIEWSNTPDAVSTISDSTIADNGCYEIVYCRGGLYINGGQLVVHNTIFDANDSPYNGNITLSSTEVTITNSRITNGVTSSGFDIAGGIFLSNASLTAVNCLVSGNRWAGVQMTGTSHSTFINCTIINNNICDFPGLFVQHDSHAVVQNSILWGNTCYGFENCQIDGSAEVSHSIIQSDEPWPGEGNLNVDPLFIDDDGRVSPDSPAIDAGDNDAFPPDIEPVDLDGNPRIVDGTGDGVAVIDIGAFEFQIPTIPGDLTGDGNVGVPDLLMLLQAWGECADCSNCPADLTGNCMVGVPDLLILLANWTG